KRSHQPGTSQQDIFSLGYPHTLFKFPAFCFAMPATIVEIIKIFRRRRSACSCFRPVFAETAAPAK
ncbi:MAG: hypothetical protein OEU62_09965, partial [Gammaproteobacteria bacterium]|nr:hypothetical protein [Gammaproteobacteria bacterium]